MSRSSTKHGMIDDPKAWLGQLEAWARAQGFSRIAGVDEVGRGPLAGPVVAAAVILPADHGIQGLADSKQLSCSARERLAGLIRQKAEGWGLGQVGPERIDRINIRAASLEAMSIAFRQLVDRVDPPGLVLVDGRDGFALPPGLKSVSQRPVVKADTLSESVAAASIIAKVHRDALMEQYHRRWPQYGFCKHKGYPTKAHKQAIQAHGPCEIHRLTFRGVKGC